MRGRLGSWTTVYSSVRCFCLFKCSHIPYQQKNISLLQIVLSSMVPYKHHATNKNRPGWTGAMQISLKLSEKLRPICCTLTLSSKRPVAGLAAYPNTAAFKKRITKFLKDELKRMTLSLLRSCPETSSDGEGPADKKIASKAPNALWHKTQEKLKLKTAHELAKSLTTSDNTSRQSHARNIFYWRSRFYRIGWRTRVLLTYQKRELEPKLTSN